MGNLTFRPDPLMVWEHPAVIAWKQVVTGAPTPESIERLVKLEGRPTSKSAVYRMYGVGRQGTPVIAKRARGASMLVERVVYQDILPALPEPTLHCYGFFEEPEGEYCWLFLEDAAGEEYSAESQEHRTLAGSWLGRFHTVTAALDLAKLLPDRGPDWYLLCLRSARSWICESLSNPALDSAHVSALQRVIGHFDTLEERWDMLTCYWQGIPKCLVHGDFVSKNARVRSEKGGLRLYVMDWEISGWGIAAPDLVRVDHAAYWSAVQPIWPQLTLGTIRQLVTIGSLFRNLGLIWITSENLRADWARWPAEDVMYYDVRLADAMKALLR